MKKIHQTAKTLVQGHQSQNMQINRYLKEKAENHLINGLWKIFLAVCWCNQTKFEITDSVSSGALCMQDL